MLSSKIQLVKPFIKWAGGKRQLIPLLEKYFPETIGDYIEPFVGGAAVFFHLRNQGRIKRAWLSDSNAQLMRTYATIQGRAGCEGIIQELHAMEEKYKSLKTDDERGEYYYSVRSSTDNLRFKPEARFLFLNKTCFNGLYRVNKKGQFNVPFGKYKNPTICDEENIKAAHQALNPNSWGGHRNGVNLDGEEFGRDYADRFERIFGIVDLHNTVVYLDPPYHPIKEDSFTSYTANGFTEKDQRFLAEWARTFAKKGSRVIVSNSNCQLIWDIYKDIADIEVVEAKRSINSKGDSRSGTTELIAILRN